MGALRAESWGVPPGCLPEPLPGMASLGSLAAASAAPLLPAPVLYGASHLNIWRHLGSQQGSVAQKQVILRVRLQHPDWHRLPCPLGHLVLLQPMHWVKIYREGRRHQDAALQLRWCEQEQGRTWGWKCPVASPPELRLPAPSVCADCSCGPWQ